MRNLKKILALVLAMVMAFSVMATANAAFEDAADIDATYDEAVEVLSALKVFKGRTEDSFAPKAKIMRAEVAAIIYRIVTGDVKDTQVGIYADYNKFDDVKSTAWYAGYVNFCANAEYIKGYGDGNFGPEDTVTGYQALAMILRAIGYDKNGEFTGSDWQVQTAAVGKKLGVTDNVTAGTLGTAATREVVAEILFQTILVPQVEYTVAFGYTDILGNNTSLGWDTFGLHAGARTVIDNWGRPGYYWYADKVTSDPICTIEEAYKAQYTTKVTECDIAAAAFSGKDKANLICWVNGAELAQTYSIQATDVYTKLGAQGRLTEIYKDRIVMIDTLLAKVTNVTAIKYDAAGHRINTSDMTLTVYDGTPTTTITLEKTTDWTYTAGQYVLINAETVTKGDLFGLNHYDVTDVDTAVLGVADSFVGAQTVIHYNDGQRTIDGVTYQENNCYHKNDASISTAKYTWFKDLYGNVIGSAVIPTSYEYGVIKNIQWFTQAGVYGYAQATMVMMDGTEKSIVVSAIADADDTKVVDTKTVIDATPLTYALPSNVSLDNGYVSTEIMWNYSEFAGTDLYRIAEDGKGGYTLVDVDNPVVGGNEETTAVTKANASMGSTIVDSSTQYLYRNVAALTDTANVNTTYTAVTGFNNIPTFTNATVDYIDTDGDNRAELVYIIGIPAAAKSAGLFYVGTNAYTQVVMTETGAVNYYVLNGFFNGAAGEIKIKAEYKTLVDTIIAAGAHVLYDVKIENGFVVAAEAIDFAENKLHASGYTGAYTNKYAIKYSVDGQVFSSKYADDVLVVTNTTTSAVASFNVTEATRVYGTLEKGVAYTSDKYVLHVVYNATNLNALEIYCYELPQGATDDMNGIVKNATMTLTNNNGTFTATLLEGTTALSGVKVYYTVSYNGGVTSTPVELPYTGTVTGGYTYADSIPMSGAGSYTVHAYAVMGDKTIAAVDYVVVQ